MITLDIYVNMNMYTEAQLSLLKTCSANIHVHFEHCFYKAVLGKHLNSDHFVIQKEVNFILEEM